jgi:hypothetical protein
MLEEHFLENKGLRWGEDAIDLTCTSVVAKYCAVEKDRYLYSIHTSPVLK